ncbi:MAG: DoxX family protein [Actinomycetota bacterium]|nr:DoxX family protein [Actinomycetota bacterium]
MTLGRSDARAARMAVLLGAFQVADIVGNALVPRARLEAHFDRLGVPASVRRLLQPMKVASSVALLAGVRRPRLRAAAAAGMVPYYAAAARFHLLAGDHPVVAAPAATLAAFASVVVLTSEAGAAHRSGGMPHGAKHVAPLE